MDNKLLKNTTKKICNTYGLIENNTHSQRAQNEGQTEYTNKTDIKTIFLKNVSKPHTPVSNEKKTSFASEKKIITTTKKWSNIKPEDLNPERQFELLLLAREFYEKQNAAAAAAATATENTTVEIERLVLPPHYTLIIEHIKRKLYSYKNQDQIKNKYCAEEFVDILRVFELLVLCNMECHYCKKKVMLLYEYIREPLQWSLDRIDNSIGHTSNNLFIACLTCNLRRRCIKPERYELTKKCVNIIRTG